MKQTIECPDCGETHDVGACQAPAAPAIPEPRLPPTVKYDGTIKKSKARRETDKMTRQELQEKMKDRKSGR